MIFGDSDGLPGLTVDKFGDYLSFQIVCAGMEARKELLVELLAEHFRPLGIYERDDVPVREKEGLEQQTGCVYGAVPELVPFLEHEAKMLADLPYGQKTGHFLDQQENRGRIRPYCADARRIKTHITVSAATPAASPSTRPSTAPGRWRLWTCPKALWKW